MTAVSRLLLSVLLAGSLLGTTSTAGRAGEPAVVKTLLDNVGMGTKIRPTYQSVVEASDGTITVKGLQYTVDSKVLKAKGKAPPFKFQIDIGTLSLRGVSDVAGKGFEVAQADYAGTTYKLNGELLAAVPELTVSGLCVRVIPHHPTELQKALGALSVVPVARKSTVPQVVVQIAGKSLIIENISRTFDGDPWTGNGTGHMTIGRVAIPHEILAMGGDQMPLKQLGYTDLVFSSDSTFKVDFTPQTLSFAFDVGLTGKDMGTLRITANVAHVPAALINAVLKGKDKPDPDKLAALANGVTISNLSLSFTDASLAYRLIDFFAARHSINRAQVFDKTATAIRHGLAYLKDGEFTDKVIAAVDSFLVAPGSLHITAAAKPVTVRQLMQSHGKPVSLIRLLHLDVEANQ